MENKTENKKNTLPTSECPTPKGVLIAIGGKENKEKPIDGATSKEDYTKAEVLRCFTDLITVENPTLEIITTAGSEGAESYEQYSKLFKELGIANTGHIHHTSRKEVLESSLVDRVNKANAFFFSGGDQLKLTSLYGGSDFLYVLKDRYIHDSIVIGGTSAGAMALSTPMIFAGNEEVQQTAGAIKITTGFEFLKDVCIDTHFIDRSRFVRMAQVIATNPTCIGIGIEEDTAVIVSNGSDVKIVGSGVVTVIEGLHIESTNITNFDDKKRISIRNLKVHLLSRDDTYTVPQTNQPHR